jgi:hypothetical protein
MAKSSFSWQQKEIKIYMTEMDRHGNPASSFQARLPSKASARAERLGIWGPPHAFMDYFQMPEDFARDCSVQFDDATKNT